MNIEEAVQDWETWQLPPASRPAVLHELTGGRTNRSYLIDAGNDRMVLRINAPPARLPGVDRQQESDILKVAATAGLAPPIRHIDTQRLVTGYIDGRSPDRMTRNALLTQQIFKLLNSVHQLKINTPRLDYAAHIDRFWKLISDSGLSVPPALTDRRADLHAMATELTGACPVALCHHDPIPANIIVSGKQPVLIDWEYAAAGCAAMDFAAVGIEWKIDAAEIVEHTGIDVSLLSTAQQVYRYLCDLWQVALRS